LASHGVGTARALQIDPQSGAFAALAMSLKGLLTALLAPLFVSWLI
jgi:putative effector of murein hydrolase